MKYKDNLGGEHSNVFRAFFTSIRNKVTNEKPTRERDRTKYEYPDVITTDKAVNCKRIDIDYETGTLLLKNEDGDVVISSKIDDVIMNSLDPNEFADGIMYGYVNLVPTIQSGLEERQEKLIDEVLGIYDTKLKELVSSNETAEFNSKLLDCQSNMIDSALKIDTVTVRDDTPGFIRKLYSTAYRKLFSDNMTGFHEN